MPATPKKGRRFGGAAAHQRLMMANLVSSLIAAEGITTTEATPIMMPSIVSTVRMRLAPIACQASPSIAFSMRLRPALAPASAGR